MTLSAGWPIVGVEYALVVKRSVRHPATGLWNRLRRRRWIVTSEVIGAYPITDMKLKRMINQPEEVEVTFRVPRGQPLV